MFTVLSNKIDAQTCRLAFHGKIIQVINIEDTIKLKVFTKKEKEGKIERVVTPNEVIAKDLFKKETDMSLFTKLFVYLPNGNKGKLNYLTYYFILISSLIIVFTFFLLSFNKMIINYNRNNYERIWKVRKV
jgi:hypothetical protein